MAKNNKKLGNEAQQAEAAKYPDFGDFVKAKAKAKEGGKKGK